MMTACLDSLIFFSTTPWTLNLVKGIECQLHEGHNTNWYYYLDSFLLALFVIILPPVVSITTYCTEPATVFLYYSNQKPYFHNEKHLSSFGPFFRAPQNLNKLLSRNSSNYLPWKACLIIQQLTAILKTN